MYSWWVMSSSVRTIVVPLRSLDVYWWSKVLKMHCKHFHLCCISSISISRTLCTSETDPIDFASWRENKPSNRKQLIMALCLQWLGGSVCFSLPCYIFPEEVIADECSPSPFFPLFANKTTSSVVILWCGLYQLIAVECPYTGVLLL